MRDAYAMHLHSVPSRFSHKVHQTPTQKDVSVRFFLCKNRGILQQIGEVAPLSVFNIPKNLFAKII